MIGKLANIQGKWKRITLTDEEIDAVMDSLLKRNAKELGRVIDFVLDLKRKGQISNDKELMHLVCLLADKQLTASYTVLNSALEEKIFAMKEGLYKEMEKAEKIVEEQLEKKEETPEKSMIDEAVEKAEESGEEKPDFSPKQESEMKELTEEELAEIKPDSEVLKRGELEKKGLFGRFRRK